MKPEGSLPQSQVPTNCPYPEPARSSPYPQIPLPEDPFYVANSLAASKSEPTLHRLLTFHVPNLTSLFRYLCRTKVSTQVQDKCSWFATKPVFTVRSCQHLVQPPSWRNTSCRLSATAYSIYSQLPSILAAVLPSITWRRAMPWWQGPTCHDLPTTKTK